MAFSIPQFQARSIIFIVASASTSGSKPKIRPARTSSLQSSKSQPSISQIERAIGVTPDQPVHSPSPSDINSSIMDFLERSPIGREGPAEKALREAAEKFTEHAEAHTASAHRFVLELFLKLLPLYILAMAVASGWIKLPFDVPFIDELIM
ncbi:Chlororespiratory reduction 3 [Rhynchospora pubera]|uniref:Chlororespiratory reduction 3 n=1 Tax=Rhynchospora pubera TaxID=906938 RepID=A0AAV8C101_9POAL|nr:Chlororespiratory reduction 3 [Rhynchospora pubera]KAJ4797929.1 Chlororespiratory reduction 3 [Rhynchospora pubera]